MKMERAIFFALILGLAVMFSVPASAFKIESPNETLFQFGAWIATDLGVWYRSKELRNGKSDNTQNDFRPAPLEPPLRFAGSR